MRILLTGVSCVGKTTIGRTVADLLGVKFFDLDEEIERFFKTSIERLQNRFLSAYSYRSEAAKALVHLLNGPASGTCVLALPPSGLTAGYWRAIKKVKATTVTVVITDQPENILERIRFYDVDSRPIEKILTPEQKKWYFRDIKKEITYFRVSYRRADLQVHIAGLDAHGAACKVIEAVRGLDETGMPQAAPE